MFKLFTILTQHFNDFRSIKFFLKCLWEEKSVVRNIFILAYIFIIDPMQWPKTPLSHEDRTSVASQRTSSKKHG